MRPGVRPALRGPLDQRRRPPAAAGALQRGLPDRHHQRLTRPDRGHQPPVRHGRRRAVRGFRQQRVLVPQALHLGQHGAVQAGELPAAAVRSGSGSRRCPTAAPTPRSARPPSSPRARRRWRPRRSRRPSRMVQSFFNVALHGVRAAADAGRARRLRDEANFSSPPPTSRRRCRGSTTTRSINEPAAGRRAAASRTPATPSRRAWATASSAATRRRSSASGDIRNWQVLAERVFEESRDDVIGSMGTPRVRPLRHAGAGQPPGAGALPALRRGGRGAGAAVPLPRQPGARRPGLHDRAGEPSEAAAGGGRQAPRRRPRPATRPGRSWCGTGSTQSRENLKDAARPRLLLGPDRKAAERFLEHLREETDYYCRLRLRAVACAEAAVFLAEVSRDLGVRRGLDAEGRDLWDGAIAELVQGRRQVEHVIRVLDDEAALLERRRGPAERRHLHRPARRRRGGGHPAQALPGGGGRLGGGRVQGGGRVPRAVPPPGGPGWAGGPAGQAARLRPAATGAARGRAAVGAGHPGGAGPGGAAGHPARGDAAGDALDQCPVRPAGRRPADGRPLQAVCRGGGRAGAGRPAAGGTAPGHPGDAGVPKLRVRQLRPAGPAGDLLRAERHPAGHHRAAGRDLAAGLPGGAARPAAAAQPQVRRALRQPRGAHGGGDRGDAAGHGPVPARGVLRPAAPRRRAGGGVQAGPGPQRLGGRGVRARHPRRRAAGQPRARGRGGAGAVRAHAVPRPGPGRRGAAALDGPARLRGRGACRSTRTATSAGPA